MNMNDLRRERGNLITEARALNDRVEAEGRDMNAEERSQWDAMISKADELRTRIERHETLSRESSDLATLEERAVPADAPNRVEQMLDGLAPATRSLVEGIVRRNPEVAS